MFFDQKKYLSPEKNFRRNYAGMLPSHIQLVYSTAELLYHSCKVPE